MTRSLCQPVITSPYRGVEASFSNDVGIVLLLLPDLGIHHIGTLGGVRLVAPKGELRAVWAIQWSPTERSRDASAARHQLHRRISALKDRGHKLKARPADRRMHGDPLVGPIHCECGSGAHTLWDTH